MALKLLGSLESSGGNVGIGIASPVSTLHIKTSVDNSVAQGLVIERSANSDRGYINYNGGGFQFRSTVGDPIVFGETDAEHMRILPDGNVGIGTTSPTEKLVVNGNIETASNDGKIGFNVGDAHTNGPHYGLGKLSGATTVNLSGYYGLSFYTNGAERVRVSSTGNVGIGTTAPLEKLHVAGKINSSNNIVSNATYTMFTGRSSRTVDDYGGLNKQYFKANLVTPGPDTTGESSAHGIADLRFQLANNAGNTGMSDIMTLRSGGNVGIGTTTPSDMLHIHATGNGYKALIVEDDARRIELGRDMITAKSADGSTVQNLYIQPAGNTAFATTSGNVGIGTTSPSAKLHVSGNILGSTITAPATHSKSKFRLHGTGNDAHSIGTASYANTYGPGTWDSGTIMHQFYGSTGDIIAQLGVGGSTASNNTSYFTGNVGIGTTSPAGKLTSYAPNGNSDSLRLGRADTDNYWQFNHAGADLRIYNVASSGSNILLGVDAGGTTKANRVGIATDNPTEKLHVSGNLRVTGAFVDSSASAGSAGTVLSSTNTGTAWVGASGLPGGPYLPLAGGAVTGNVEITGDTASPHSDNAFLVLRGSDGSNALRVQNSGEVVVQNNYLYAAGTGTSLYVQANAVFRGNILNDTSGAPVTISDNLVVNGNLTVDGTTTTLNTTTVEVQDNILQLNTTQGTPDTATAATSGISVYRGDGVTQASLIFDDGDDVWDLTNKLKVASNIYSGGNVFQIEGANPYIKGTGSGSMRIKHTAGQTMYIRPDETGQVSFFEGANSQPVYFMTQTPTVNNTTRESAQLKFQTRSKQSDGNSVSKYATIKHLTHSIGYNYTTLDFSGSDKSKFNMPIEVAGNVTLNGDGKLLKFTPTSYDDVELGIDSNGFVIYNTTDSRYDLKISGDGNATFAGDVSLADSKKLILGAGDDLKIFHNATDSFIINEVGDLKITNGANDKDIIFQSDDGSGGTATYFYLDGSSAITRVSRNLRANDSVALQVGSNGDAGFFHNGTDTSISNDTGDLIIQNNANDKDIVFKSDDNSGGVTTYFHLDGSLKKTQFWQSTRHIDNVYATFGTSDDLQIYHDGSNSYIADVGTGTLNISGSTIVNINAANGENGIQVIENAGVKLRHNNNARLETTSTGVTVTGDLTVSDVRTGSSGGLNLGDDSSILSIGRSNEIWTQNDVNGSATLYVNYRGYNGGSTQFRSLDIRDGKAGQIASFNGSDKSVSFAGNAAFAGAVSTGGYLTLNSSDEIPRLIFNGSGDNFMFSNTANYFGLYNDTDSRWDIQVDGAGNTTFAGTINSGTITSTGIVKAATTFQSTAGSMSFYVPNVGQALEIAQNTGNATFAGSITTGGDINVPEYVVHDGDTNTHIRFTADRIRLVAGGTVKFDSNSPYITGLDWTEIAGDPANINISGFNNDSGYLTAVPEFLEEKYIYNSNDSNGVYMPMVKGGMYTSTSSAVTGAIKVKLPAYKSNMMFTVYVDVFEYTTGETVTLRVSGYAYGDAAASWYNCSVVNIADNTDRNYTVRFYSDTTNSEQYFTIGETNSTWSYPQVNLRDFWGGYNTNETEAKGTWDVSFVTTFNGSLKGTFTDNFAASDWNRIRDKPSTFAPIIGTGAAQAMAGNTVIPSGNAVIDWTTDQGTTNIHSGNYNNTQLSNAEVISAVVASSSIDDADKGTIRSNIGAGTSSLAIGTTSTTAMAGNTSLFDGAYSSLSGTPTLGTAAAAATGDFATAAQGTTADAALPKAGGTMTGDLVMADETINFVTGGSVTLPQFTGLRATNDLNDRSWSTQGGWAYTTFDSHSSVSNTPSTGLHNANGLLTFNTHSGDYMAQIAMTTNTQKLWTRARNGGGWMTWYQIFTSADFTAANVANGVTAYGWGDHGAAGYITSQRAISSTPTDGATTTAISSDWAFDNVKTAVPVNAVFTDTVYTHPTTAGNKHIPSGGSSGQFLRYSSSGTAVWATPSYTTNTNTTYSAGTGLDLTGTTFSIEPDLRDGVTRIGKDTSNYIAIGADTNVIDFHVGGVWVARMESDGDLHMKGDVIAFSDIFNP